jgi:hypothetical protein
MTANVEAMKTSTFSDSIEPTPEPAGAERMKAIVQDEYGTAPGVQVAKAFGADVTGVCSTSKMNLVRALGADHVIDYKQDDFAEADPALRRDHRHRRQ